MMSQGKRDLTINRFLAWCERIGYSGKDGVTITIVDGVPIAVERSTQSIRFDVDDTLTKPKQNGTMD